MTMFKILLALGNFKIAVNVNELSTERKIIQQKYVVEGLSAQQIADEIDCSKMAVLDALVKFDIHVREPHYHHGHPSQPRYGKKYQKKLLMVHKIEARVIGVISKLRKNGLTLRQIAQVL